MWIKMFVRLLKQDEGAMANYEITMTKAYVSVKGIAGEILKMPVGVLFTAVTIRSSKTSVAFWRLCIWILKHSCPCSQLYP
jgi:hypothetical protein